MRTSNAGPVRNVALLSLAVIVISACATTTTTKRTAARIEIQEEVGFTITEEARISSDVRLDYDQALTLLEQGRHDQGVDLLEAVAEAAPYLSAPHIDLAIAYRSFGDLAAAEKNLLLALESSPEHPIAHNELGIVYRKTGRFAEARRSYEAALAVYPGYHYARRNLAILCDLYLADLGCALENYEAYMATVPSDDEASMWIADIRQRMGRVED
ncbi:MAG: tetratricopeptide repeat protein [Gammaproteobacteria bacterium]|nr:tetratricopeptide repeat protein [Gammaproteobacteria bacterium]